MQRKLIFRYGVVEHFLYTEKTYALVKLKRLNSPGRSIQVYMCRRDCRLQHCSVAAYCVAYIAVRSRYYTRVSRGWIYTLDISSPERHFVFPLWREAWMKIKIRAILQLDFA